jgi:acyl-CoA thioester hydrolase
MAEKFSLDDFPSRTFDKIRYRDTDRLGHVNNAVFATLLETGRVEILYDNRAPLADPGNAFVIARLTLEFIGEITWPGRVDIGTRVGTVGRSSVTLVQALFQNNRLVAKAETIIVQVNEATRRSQALSPKAVSRLTSLMAAPVEQAKK